MTKVMTQLTNDDDKGDNEFDGHDDVDDDGHLAPKSRGETLPCFPHWPQKVLQGKLKILPDHQHQNLYDVAIDDK